MGPLEVVKAWLRAFNRADPDAMASFYAPAATLHLVPDQPVEGHEAIWAAFVELFAGPEMIWMVENLFECGDWAILEWRDPFGLRGSGFFLVREGNIVLQRSYLDRLSFLRQNGLPVPRDWPSDLPPAKESGHGDRQYPFNRPSPANLLRQPRHPGPGVPAYGPGKAGGGHQDS